tara:strand:+ start:167 stop:970 length:804 start_codon:yes stop_codon:yes gene_type:complete
MPKYSGQISKLSSVLANPVKYKFIIGNHKININDFIGYKINVIFNGDIYCISCNAKIKKTFMQGYCYPCFINSPMTSECILRPHLCEAQDGISRNMEWSKQHCLDDHYVYLSITSNLKVGVTRKTQIPTRWIDQGAHYAIKFCKTPNRYLAGCVEIEIAKYISDRTQWRKMLKGEFEKINLLNKKKELLDMLPDNLKKYISNNNDIINISYPIYKNLSKVKSINLDKTPEISGKITGIKGQYIMIDNEYVLNVRKYTGYILQILLKK